MGDGWVLPGTMSPGIWGGGRYGKVEQRVRDPGTEGECAKNAGYVKPMFIYLGRGYPVEIGGLL